MAKGISYEEARGLLMDRVTPVKTEKASLEDCFGRILAADLYARDNVPPFNRSPYDGYAFRSADTREAGQDHPVTLRVLDEVPAGKTTDAVVTEGTAVKVMTGAQIPEGADAVEMFEKTVFTADTVTLGAPVKAGSNIVTIGEDIKKGALLAAAGTLIDAGLLGTLASQNVKEPEVYKVPLIGVISTGSELKEAGEVLAPGMIYNSNRYTLSSVLRKHGCRTVYIGTAKDTVEEIASLIRKALASCDAVVLSGGVSVGDYDLTPDAMEKCGAEFLFRRVALKPGMACAYGMAEGKPVIGLSGNPASSVTNLCAIALPALRKLAGRCDPLLPELEVTLKNGFKKPSKSTRLLRGTLDLSDGTVRMTMPRDQGNVVLSSTIGCDVMAVVPAGSGPLEAGTKLKGFLL